MPSHDWGRLGINVSATIPCSLNLSEGQEYECLHVAKLIKKIKIRSLPFQEGFSFGHFQEHSPPAVSLAMCYKQLMFKRMCLMYIKRPVS